MTHYQAMIKRIRDGSYRYPDFQAPDPDKAMVKASSMVQEGEVLKRIFPVYQGDVHSIPAPGEKEVN